MGVQAEIICIGNELLTGLVENSNAGYISRRLWSRGIAVREQRVVPDSIAAIVEALKESLRRSEAVICIGGLGPTDDDLTREAVAELLRRPLQLHREWLQHLEQFFARRGRPMPAANRKQALVVEGSRLLFNPRGTAPGAIIPAGERRWLILLPGPPEEMAPMFEEEILPFLEARREEGKWLSRLVRTAGCGESELEEKVKRSGLPGGVDLSYVARGGEVLLQLKSCAEDAAERLENAAARLRKELGRYVYGEGEQTLAGAVAALFMERGLTLAAAESCSGGLLADSITNIPGSSLFFKGSLVTYSNEAKEKLLGVAAALLEREGAVSEPVALAMARGARERLNASVGAAITGIAGPGSDASGKPVGLVYIAAAGPWGERCLRLDLPGTRRAIKERAVQALLTLLWRMMRTEEP
ncbi:MAG: competence/damage-inducible protein A [Firmicutes bacterium]|jgi:nicotinamide-nucleotide amidase|nr:competence/damage-inducible protein A [Bacillota bacterium]